ncbi:MAG: hypothetical protein ACYCZK_07820, partial [Microbacteriaceae bacterium]
LNVGKAAASAVDSAAPVELTACCRAELTAVAWLIAACPAPFAGGKKLGLAVNGADGVTDGAGCDDADTCAAAGTTTIPGGAWRRATVIVAAATAPAA